MAHIFSMCQEDDWQEWLDTPWHARLHVDRVLRGKVVECDTEGCSAKSANYAFRSPAAPQLDICEAAHKKEGWSYSLGFFAMLCGHTNHCPQCVKDRTKCDLVEDQS